MSEFECFSKYVIMKGHKEIADSVLMDFVREARRLGVLFYFKYGTCLGFVRDGNYIDCDNDIDIGVQCTRKKWDELMGALRNIGFVIPDNDCGIHMVKDKVMLDVARTDGVTIEHEYVCFDKVQYNGEEFSVPHPVEDYLTKTYGEWRRPHWIEPYDDKYAVYRRYKEQVLKDRRKRQETWNSIATEWERRKGHREERLEPFQVEARLDFLTRLREQTKILDVGCGKCRDLSYFRNFGFSCVGVDFSVNMIKGGRDVVLGSALKLPFLKESFDGVWCNSLLKHLRRTDLFMCLKEVRRVLKDSGVFWAGLDEGVGEAVESFKNGEVTFSLYSMEEFMFLVEKLGFKILKVQKVQAWRNFISILLEKQG